MLTEDFMIIIMADMYTIVADSIQLELTKTLIPEVAPELENIPNVRVSFWVSFQEQRECAVVEP